MSLTFSFLQWRDNQRLVGLCGAVGGLGQPQVKVDGRARGW